MSAERKGARLRAELLTLVDGRDDIVRALEAVLDHARESASDPTPLVSGKDRRWRQRVLDDLLRPAAALDSMLRHAADHEDEYEGLVRSLDRSCPILRSGTLDDFRADLRALVETLADFRSQQQVRRGRKPNTRRRSLEAATIHALQRGGLTLTKGSDGRFAKILGVMYEAAGIRGPLDVFPVLDRLLPKRRGKSLH